MGDEGDEGIEGDEDDGGDEGDGGEGDGGQGCSPLLRNLWGDQAKGCTFIKEAYES